MKPWLSMLSMRTTSLFAFLFAITISGCGPGQGDLTGKITYMGKTVCSGSILVKGTDGMIKDAKIEGDGSYLVKGIAAGQVEIVVHSPDPGVVPVVERYPHPLPAPGDRSKWFPIPEKYSDFRTPELTFFLKSGQNTWDIDLK